jgi:hypothetical protein
MPRSWSRYNLQEINLNWNLNRNLYLSFLNMWKKIFYVKMLIQVLYSQQEINIKHMYFC